MFDPTLSRSYWPEHERKSRPRILVDLLLWLIRNGEVNDYYYVYGLDLRAAHRSRDVLPYRVFRHIRDRENLQPGKPWNYVCVLRDKWLFSQVASSLGVPAPKVHALLDSQRVLWLDGRAGAELETLREPGPLPLDGFCKKVTSIKGGGAFALRLESGRLFVNDVEVTVAQLRARLDGRFLFQERIAQHPALSVLHPPSLNTIRLVTFCRNTNATLFSAALRVGAGGKRIDNWAAGGLIVGIDPERGRLRADGFFKPRYGARVPAHPDTGVRFAGYEIPYFREAVELVLRTHRHVGHIHSIGWDVGVTPGGPIIIEGNDDWGGSISMTLEKDFRRRFLHACTATATS